MDAIYLKTGMTVTYIPNHARSKISHPDREVGKVRSWNDRFVLVDYGTGTAKATSLENLQIGNQTFACHNELNSVLDGAFGRCETQCDKCAGRLFGWISG